MMGQLLKMHGDSENTEMEDGTGLRLLTNHRDWNLYHDTSTQLHLLDL